MVSEKKSPRALATPGHTTGRHGVGTGWAMAREIYLPTTTPGRGDLGSLRASHSLREYKMKKDSLKLSFSF